jgi:hypothetical protein
MNSTLESVLARLDWMHDEGLWPDGRRYLWTDAWGVLLYVSLWEETANERWLDTAEALVAEVERVLGRPRGLRIGEGPEREGQYYHYLAMWMFALQRLGRHRPGYREKAIELVRQVHPRFVVPGVGVVWKMSDDLSASCPGFGLGTIDAFHGYVVYRLIDEDELAGEIAHLRRLVERCYPSLHIQQDLGLGLLLWLSHFFPDEAWARVQRARSLHELDGMWIDPPGYFCRAPDQPETRFAFTNHGISVGLQAVGAWPQRVLALRSYFDSYRSHDRYDVDPITHVMACAARLPGALLQREVAPRTRTLEGGLI